jgi:hypothetical protein
MSRFNLDRKSKDIDYQIRTMIDKYIEEEGIDLSKPLSLNIKFSKEDEIDIIDDLETFVETRTELFVTIYTPCNLNQLRFEVVDNNKIIIKNHDYSYYKQFWFSCLIDKDSMEPSFKNNVFELKFQKKL